MTKVLKKYWWVVAIVIGMPIMVNVILLIPAFLPVVGENTHWLTFFGGYIGCLISTFVALFVLYRQLKQNQEENEKNRVANEEANEKNRKLQIKVLEYQQQMQWLHSFREASAQYVQIYNANDLIAIANVLIANPQEAHNMLKPLFNRAAISDTQFAYWRKDDNDTKELMEKITPKFKRYNDVLLDIQQIIAFRRSYPTAMFGSLATPMQMMGMTDVMKNKITQISKQQPGYLQQSSQLFVGVVMARIDDMKDDMAYIQDLLYNYVHSEQARINKILEESYGTKQIK
ncbi:MAG: hypothetical protein K2J84_07955 [Bacteroidaceae bacterium]|nr:hypothetical protein [Bacteroidaceae bacterium]